jgi:hypothetical protein
MTDFMLTVDLDRLIVINFTLRYLRHQTQHSRPIQFTYRYVDAEHSRSYTVGIEL